MSTPSTNLAIQKPSAYRQIGKGLAGTGAALGIGLLLSGLVNTIAEKKRNKRIGQIQKLLAVQRGQIAKMHKVQQKPYERS